MGLTDLVLLIKGENGETENHITIFFGARGGAVMCNDNEKLTNHEIHYALAVAYIHVGAQLKGIVMEPEDTVHKGFKLYSAFHNTYKGMRSIEEMSLDEFNKYMRDHNL